MKRVRDKIRNGSLRGSEKFGSGNNNRRRFKLNLSPIRHKNLIECVTLMVRGVPTEQVFRDLSLHGLTGFENVRDGAQTRLAITRSLILMTRSQQLFFSSPLLLFFFFFLLLLLLLFLIRKRSSDLSRRPNEDFM